MLKIILDSNVILSAVLFGGQAKKVLDHVIATQTLCLSPELTNEIINKLITKFHADIPFVNDVISLLSTRPLFKPEKTIDICRDSKDNFILDLALASTANLIITGDKDLLTLVNFHHTKIITIKQYLETYTISSLA